MIVGPIGVMRIGVTSIGVMKIVSSRTARRFAIPPVAAMIAVVATSCSPPVSSDRATRQDQLTVSTTAEGVYCDGVRRPAAEVSGAEPGETIEFVSPMPIDIGDGTADETGRFQLSWRCDPLESQLSWDVTATGSRSGRSARFTIAGSDRDPLLDRVLVHEPTSDFALCDETSRTVARLSNAEPNEIVALTSPDVDSIAPTFAGPNGEVAIRWTCSPDEDGRDWRITATGGSSDRSAEFIITGQAPRPADPGDIVVEIVEDPFVCDRGRRPVARLTNLTPNATLEFVVSPSDERLRPGEAGSDGSSKVFWQCDRRDEGTTWELTVTEATPARRSASFVFGSTTLESPVTIEIVEDPFVCDGAARRFAVVRNFVPREAIDFESPQSEAIRQGRADGNGSLAVRWSCTADQAGTVWEVTATGATSGASLSFTITGSAP